jgi:hypothetical protein
MGRHFSADEKIRVVLERLRGEERILPMARFWKADNAHPPFS